MRKVIINKFPQHVSSQGEINYSGILKTILKTTIFKHEHLADSYYLEVDNDDICPVLYLVNNNLPKKHDMHTILLFKDTTTPYNGYKSYTPAANRISHDDYIGRYCKD